MKRLIVNADDLGICESTNNAIAVAHRDGILTSTSLLATGPAFEHAIEQVVRRHPRLGVGLHVCLTNARCVGPKEDVPLLVDKCGRFRRSFSTLFALTLVRRLGALQQIEREVAAQFAKLHENGVTIDHVDGHRHVHMIPVVFRIVTQVAKHFGCPNVRVSNEPLRPPRLPLRPAQELRRCLNLPKQVILRVLASRIRRCATELGTADRVFGILNTGNMEGPAIYDALEYAEDGATEIITHPGGEFLDFPETLTGSERRFLRSPHRIRELRALLEDDIRDKANRMGWTLSRYSDIRAPQSAGSVQIQSRYGASACPNEFARGGIS